MCLRTCSLLVAAVACALGMTSCITDQNCDLVDNRDSTLMTGTLAGNVSDVSLEDVPPPMLEGAPVELDLDLENNTAVLRYTDPDGVEMEVPLEVGSVIQLQN